MYRFVLDSIVVARQVHEAGRRGVKVPQAVHHGREVGAESVGRLRQL